MNRRSALGILLLMNGWTNTVVAQKPPRLQMEFGGETGFSGIDVFINGERIAIEPDELLKALKTDG